MAGRKSEAKVEERLTPRGERVAPASEGEATKQPVSVGPRFEDIPATCGMLEETRVEMLALIEVAKYEMRAELWRAMSERRPAAVTGACDEDPPKGKAVVEDSRANDQHFDATCERITARMARMIVRLHQHKAETKDAYDAIVAYLERGRREEQSGGAAPPSSRGLACSSGKNR